MHSCSMPTNVRAMQIRLQNPQQINCRPRSNTLRPGFSTPERRYSTNSPTRPFQARETLPRRQRWNSCLSLKHTLLHCVQRRMICRNSSLVIPGLVARLNVDRMACSRDVCRAVGSKRMMLRESSKLVLNRIAMFHEKLLVLNHIWPS